MIGTRMSIDMRRVYGGCGIGAITKGPDMMCCGIGIRCMKLETITTDAIVGPVSRDIAGRRSAAIAADRDIIAERICAGGTRYIYIVAYMVSTRQRESMIGHSHA
jgi:hypothetical protein